MDAAMKDYKANKRKLHNAKLLAYIQSTKLPATVHVKLSCPGLKQQLFNLNNAGSV